MLRHAVDHPGRLGAVLDEETPSPVQAAAEVIAEGQRRGEIRADRPAEALAVVLCHSVLSATRRGATLGRPPDSPPLSQLTLEVVLRGMRPDDADPNVARARHDKDGGASGRTGRSDVKKPDGPRSVPLDLDLDLDTFVRDGYVAVRGAVDPKAVATCRELIWTAMERRDIGRNDPGSWPPLVQGMDDDVLGEALVEAYLSPTLTAAYDELIGQGRWKRSVRPDDLTPSIIVRFPAEDRANAGYHIDGSYRGPNGRDNWVNIRSKARGLLALILFTDIGRQDAPTRLICGSHLAVPPFLASFGDAGTDADTDDAKFWRPSTLCMNVAHTTGKAGDVFLCHPFMVHTATWPHHGTGPRMIAQPAVNAPDGFVLDGSDPSPVAQAIVNALAVAN